MSEHAGKGREGFALHRIENFSDAVFAFAVTLLVVSLEVPKSAHELFETMHGVIAFGVCFALLVLVWVEHARFFRHYPLTDARTVTLNMVLLFTVLVYVYPMKFLFTMLFDQWIWSAPRALQSVAEVRTLMIIYGLGIAAVNTVFLLMHLHARRQRAALRLDERALVLLTASMLRNLVTGGVALVSIMIVCFTSDTGAVSGPIYMAIGPLNYACIPLAERLHRA
ncbi:MAG: TMEM175 family protein [Pseudomonadota bacterium]